jgi:multimeric flavodoxin WrbA/putative sterol carrier protein
MTKTESILSFMTSFLNPQKSKGVNLTYSFRFSGEEGGEFSLSVMNGVCSFSHGIQPDATTLIECEAKIWISIAEGRTKPWQAMLRKEMKIHGSKLAMMRFGSLFSGDPVADSVPANLYKETSNERDFKRGITSKAEKVLVIQASPRGKEGATEILLRELIGGLEESGSVVDVEYLATTEIKPCTGCYTCWSITDGVCIHKDNMSTLMPRIPSYDLLVLAAPLYCDSVPGKLKSFSDRLIPLSHPFIFNKNGRCRHPSRHAKLPNAVLLSVCGFYELENFNSLVKLLQDNTGNSHMPLVATLLRPHSHVLLGDMKFKSIDRVLAATRKAGRELAETGRVSRKTQREVSKPLTTRALFLAVAKNWWEIEGQTSAKPN